MDSIIDLVLEFKIEFEIALTDGGKLNLDIYIYIYIYIIYI